MEVAVVGKEPVGFLEDAAGVELAVEDPEAVEVAEVVVDNQGKNLKDALIWLDFSYIFYSTYKGNLNMPMKMPPTSKIFFVILRIVQICETMECLKA